MQRWTGWTKTTVRHALRELPLTTSTCTAASASLSTGVIADPARRADRALEEQVDHLEKRVATQEERNAELTAVQAVARLAAQHEEITRLRAALTSGGVVRSLPTGRGSQ